MGRLRRTTAFVAGTSYAPTGEVEALVAKVRRIHARIRGQTAQGEPYAADDPQLLTWVHVTEAFGFLQGFRRYGREVPGTSPTATMSTAVWPRRWCSGCRAAKPRWRRTFVRGNRSCGRALA